MISSRWSFSRNVCILETLHLTARTTLGVWRCPGQMAKRTSVTHIQHLSHTQNFYWILTRFRSFWAPLYFLVFYMPLAGGWHICNSTIVLLTSDYANHNCKFEIAQTPCMVKLKPNEVIRNGEIYFLLLYPCSFVYWQRLHTQLWLVYPLFHILINKTSHVILQSHRDHCTETRQQVIPVYEEQYQVSIH